ncbi:hypothetical protein GLOTRDRAFT_132262 [Gloeophyllum trabeum ATCC 11539]|uniref:Uncharacterized protein n=1 Tax=Gloeophyllum trabeum (strain ATCC 11539 / FP-39264 / Madison 617) TaxID=670483 RepID=S7PX00_GLOTA|nr:uncharacterized protein GLOTRDRAFT_132262 [Gloeophyllum trabeum ATCC 11539]EPQ52146.1 hypothetical protein GLOTRDRAFT_132262 [Gloeophyllum trabeum ATCC 11539]
MSKVISPGPRQANGVEKLTTIWAENHRWMKNSTCSVWSETHKKVAVYECLIDHVSNSTNEVGPSYHVLIERA